jgi:membrane-associated phospholipid phosphatase
VAVVTGRGVGVTEAVAGAVPDALVAVLVALTFLGSTYFVTSAGPVLYLFGARVGLLSRRDGARLLAVSVGALALVVVLKGAFAEPRPPESVMQIAAAGNGFPSGHATGAAAFYAAAAVVTGIGTRTRRYAAAGGLIVLVAFTRVALGVHYLVDVVAGVAVGVGFAAVALAVTDRSVAAGFALGAALAAGGVAVAGPTPDALGAFGGTSGALLGWVAVEQRDALTDRVAPVRGLAVVAVAGGAAAATLATDAALPVVLAAHAAAGLAFVGLPAAQNVSR